MLKIFDSHSHLNSEAFLGREEEVIEQARAAGVEKINIVGVDEKTNDWAIALAERFSDCYATIGWHPDDCAKFDGMAEKYLREHLSHPKVLALGEIGLDYHWMVSPKWLQAEVFRRQIKLSKEMNRPFMVHMREALDDTYQILSEEGIGSAGAIMHSFSGTYEEALKFSSLGMMISLSGVLTFKKATDLQEAAKCLPLDKLLVETDAPYLTPHPFRGKENQPAYSRYTLEKLAELRDCPVETIADAIYQNTRRIFKVDEKKNT